MAAENAAAVDVEMNDVVAQHQAEDNAPLDQEAVGPYHWLAADRRVRVDSHETITSKLKEMLELVGTLGENGTIAEGPLVTLSNQLRDAFGACEAMREECYNAGSMSVGYCSLIPRGEHASFPAVTHMLSDRGFCQTLVNLKVEQLRIYQQEPEKGPRLSAVGCISLEMWGNDIVDGVMSAWAKLLYKWKMHGEIVAEVGEHLAGRDPGLVPRTFVRTVCNLILMRLNLWPTIKQHLDKMHIRGRHMFPTDLWSNSVVNLCMNEEPRCISFVADAGHIDMNALARKGPIRRSDTARREATFEGLTDQQKLLLKNGAEYIRDTFPKGQYPFQGTWWDASIFTWPRETLPKLEDLMETILK
jgi:hypothetical protein